VAELARAEGIEMVPVPVPGNTRTALTIQDAETGQYWHYLEPGPELGAAELERIRSAYREALAGCHTVVISGSLPCRSAAALVPWMVRTAREQGARAALDSWGAALLPALEAGPRLVKPNVAELEATLGETLDTEARRWSALSRIAAWGVETATLSMGAEGALALVRGARYRIHPPDVTEVNDLGGGDSMVAGLCWAAQAGYNAEECLRWGAACGAANAEVWDPAAISRGRVEELLAGVRVEALGP
jgi:1-phosphofructokinase family hexose kinase